MSEPNRVASRIQSAIETCRAWDADSTLLVECRAQIPFHLLCPEQYYIDTHNRSKGNDVTIDDEKKKERSITKSPFAKNDDDKYEGDDLLLKRLTLFFQDLMTWVNNPPCSHCGCTTTESRGSRGAETKEEREGKASRVELYHCPTCNSTTTFPRYNSPRKLLETKKGRCGEYANLFGLFCRAAGFDARYISDLTDHVWIEVWSNQFGRWIMADSCEGQIDKVSMYEKGWGKKLSYIFGVTLDSVADVTQRYTRKKSMDDFQARRISISPGGDLESETIISQLNASLRANGKVSKSRIDELDRRDRLERYFFDKTKYLNEWEKDEYSEGRISGSLSWRVSRREYSTTQKNISKHDEKDVLDSSQYLHEESFHPDPFGSNVSVCVKVPLSPAQNSFHNCINVSNIGCGIGFPECTSVVVIDEVSGCILQSRVFCNLLDASNFLKTIPDGRVIALCSCLTHKEDCMKHIEDNMCRIGGFNLKVNQKNQDTDNYLLFIGQINFCPDWAICRNGRAGTTICVALEINCKEEFGNLKLKKKDFTIPRCISMRIPEDIMPLTIQLSANESQKRAAFQKFIEKEKMKDDVKDMVHCAGYTTKSGLPIYLFASNGFPLRKYNMSKEKANEHSWKTYHFLPSALVPDSDDIIEKEQDSDPVFDIPLDESYFNELLGPSLIKNNETNQISVIDTTKALKKASLVALYFSAHWCPPCRQFTPILCEFYASLRKEVCVGHGFEIVFISADRDSNSFNSYFGTMPWYSIDYHESKDKHKRISDQFGIRGFPALVVLDSVSGQIVVSKDSGRMDVTNACKTGDSGITNLFTNSWVKRIPLESQMIMESLRISLADSVADEEAKETSTVITQYLTRPNDIDPSLLVEKKFSELVSKGFSPNDAAAQAIKAVAYNQSKLEQTLLQGATLLCEGKLKGCIVIGEFLWGSQKNIMNFENNGSHHKEVMEIAKKYFENVEKNSSTYRFRSFKLSNKIFDRITCLPFGIETIRSIGFEVYCTDTDFMACIPLATDLVAMRNHLKFC